MLRRKLVNIVARGQRAAVVELAKPLIANLSGGAELDASHQHSISVAASLKLRAQGSHSDIIAQNELPLGAVFLLEGWAVRYRSLSNGRRQILSFLLPGDICVASPIRLFRMDHSIASLTPVQYAEVSQADFKYLLESSVHIGEAFHWAMQTELSVQREWTVNIGQRDALSRVAHLLCELFVRLRDRRLAEGARIFFPPTQSDIADALGLTAVHVNRMLQLLRKDKLISLNGRELIVSDFDGLASAAMFDPAYLHIGRPSSHRV